MYSGLMLQVQPVTPLYVFKDGPAAPVRAERPENAPGESDEDGRRLVCRVCGHPVTTEAARMSVNGSHEHVFFNPHGIMFELGCFGSAPGAGTQGPPVSEFSWFAGHSWQIAVCGACVTHLSWRFASNDASFYGLIPSALQPEEDG